MTTIAYRDGVMAAEQRVSIGNTIFGSSVKIRGIKKYIVGAAGERSEIEPFFKWITSGMKPEKQPSWGKGEEAGFSAILVHKSRPEEINYYFTTKDGVLIVDRMSSPYCAIGSGRSFALGAMAAGATAEDAVRAAIKHDPYSGGEIDKLSV